MRYFYDTEFIENGTAIDLISIGVMADDKRDFYAQNLECDFSKANDWVRENVFPSLIDFDLVNRTPIIYKDDPTHPPPFRWTPWMSKSRIAAKLLEFVHGDTKPEFWGYYSAYDHVALCQLFGKMIDLPKDWPMYTRDIKQLCDSLGNPKLPEQGKGEHHALADAKWNRDAYNFLVNTSTESEPSFTVKWTDQLAQATVVHWIARAMAANVPEEKIRKARERLEEIIIWQSDHPERVKRPD